MGDRQRSGMVRRLAPLIPRAVAAQVARWDADPIAWAERRRIERSGLLRRRLILPWLMAAALLISALAFAIRPLSASIADMSRIEPSVASRALEGVSETAAGAALALLAIHALMMSGLGSRMAAGTVAREKQGRTWETLILTGIPAQRLILGKWWGVLRAVAARHRTALILRLALAFWLALTVGTTLEARMSADAGAAVLLLVVLHIALNPLIAAALVSAVSVFSSTLANSEAAAVRVNTLVGGALVMVFVGAAFTLTLFLPLFDLQMAVPLALLMSAVDGGLSGLLFVVVAPDGGEGACYLLGVALWIGLVLLLIRALLWIAVRRLRAQGVGAAADASTARRSSL